MGGVKPNWLEAGKARPQFRAVRKPCFNGSPEIIRLTVMMYVRYPLSPRQVEDLLFDRH